MRDFFLLPVHGEKVPEGRMRGGAMRGGNERKTKRARELRNVDNEAEDTLWHELRGRRLNGYKFVRQLPIGPYFADFACRDANLVVEVDGSQHADRSQDRFRDETMNRNGWSVLRLWHADVLTDRASVLDTILAALEGRLTVKMIGVDAKYLPAFGSVESKS
jgi:very-short-patch-repair endonuclease